MHVFDILIVIVASIYVAIGIRRGCIEEIFHLVAMIGGFVGAYFSYPFIYRKIGFLPHAAQVKTVIAFVLAYVCIAFSLIVIGWFVKKVIHMTILGWIDRLLGGLIGIGKAIIVIWIFVLSVSLLPPSPLKSSFTASGTYKLLTKLPVRLSIPGRGTIKKSYEKLKKNSPAKKLKEAKKKINKFKRGIDTFRTFVDSA